MPPDSSEPNDWCRQTMATLLGYLAAGKMRPLVAERIPLLEAEGAHALLEQSPHAGKIVLVASMDSGVSNPGFQHASAADRARFAGLRLELPGDVYPARQPNRNRSGRDRVPRGPFVTSPFVDRR